MSRDFGPEANSPKGELFRVGDGDEVMWLLSRLATEETGQPGRWGRVSGIDIRRRRLRSKRTDEVRWEE